jgi:hypothetical protein
MNETLLMKMYLAERLALLLIEDNPQMSLEQALSTVFNSDTYQKIQNENTHLYSQSPYYVYSFLDTELKTGKMA